MKIYRILVTGWRDWPATHAGVISEALEVAFWNAVSNSYDHVTIVHGQCPYGGVDLYADQWATAREMVSPERHPAERGPRGQILGPARNSKMVNLGANLCLAFPGPNSKGTWDCAAKAVNADIPTEFTAWCSRWAINWEVDLDLPAVDHLSK